MQPIRVKVKKLHPDVSLPKQSTPGAAGWDVCAWLPVHGDRTIGPSERYAVPTGLSFEIPRGYEIQVRGRSGLALYEGLMVPNSPGTIDSDYRGELKVILLNTQHHNVTVTHGQRIAQVLVKEVPPVEFIETSELSETQRGEGGFGSTGLG